jgi:hypothetical protein
MLNIDSISITQRDNHGRFIKGCTPLNKGKKIDPELYDRIKHTMFKKGRVPATSLYFGKPYIDTRCKKTTPIKIWLIRINGRQISYLKYLCIKSGIDMKGKIPRLKSEYNWDHVPTLDDINVITFKQNILLNSFYRYPQDVQDLIHAKSALTRTINNNLNK